MRRILSIFVLVLIVVGIPLGVYLYVQRSGVFSQIFLQDKEIDSLNKQIEEFGKRYHSATITDAPTINEIKVVAEERQQKMLTLARDNPQKFLANTLEPSQIENLPSEIKDSPLIEQPIKTSGELVVTHLENFDNHSTKLEYAIKQSPDDQTTVSLIPVGTIDVKQSGAAIGVTGTIIGNTIVIPSTGEANFQVNSLPAINESTQDHKVLVIMFNFLNDKNNPDTSPSLKNKIFDADNSSNAYYRDSSYGQISLSGDIVGPFTIPFEKIEGNCYDYNQWAISADTLAYTNGINPTLYQHVIYSFPRPDNCWAGAWADIGGKHARVYLPGQFESGLITHEIGHNLGFYHARFRQCNASMTTSQLTYSDKCTDIEYGDIYDVMGQSGTYFHSINAPHRAQLGWLKPNQIQTVSQSGTYTITPLSNNDSYLKTLRIPLTTLDTSYYVEYRPAIGFDNNLSSYETSGVQIRSFSDYTTDLLDPNISLSDASIRRTASEYNRSILQDGSIFVDTDNGLTIQLLSHSPNNAVVAITRDDSLCQRQKPDVTLSPNITSATLDQTIQLHLTLTNRDSSGCSDGVFNGSVWGDSLNTLNSSFNETVLSPGKTFNLDFSAKFDPKATLGVHTLKANVSSASHQNETSSQFTLTGGISDVMLSQGNINTFVGNEPTHLSALAYDTYGRPLWNNLTYDWGMSSNNSVGTVKSDVNIADFVPTKAGRGDLFVTAVRDGAQVTKSISVTVSNPPSPSPSPSASPLASLEPSPPANKPGDANGDNNVDGVDYVVWLNHYNQSVTGGSTVGDWNLDSKVDGIDYVIWLNNYHL